MLEAVKKAVEVAGGQTALGNLVGVSQGHIWSWLNRSRKCPPEKVLQVERATGVSRHELRPDIYGSGPEAPASSAA